MARKSANKERRKQDARNVDFGPVPEGWEILGYSHDIQYLRNQGGLVRGRRSEGRWVGSRAMTTQEWTRIRRAQGDFAPTSEYRVELDGGPTIAAQCAADEAEAALRRTPAKTSADLVPPVVETLVVSETPLTEA